MNLFYLERIDWKDFMDGIDTDHNGKVDFREFSAAAQNHVSAINKDNLSKTFRIFDLNGDGYIVREEMEEIFARSSNSRDGWKKIWNQICEEADSNNDGKIDQTEF